MISFSPGVAFRREFHLLARTEIVRDQEDALSELAVPVVRERVADRGPLDPPSGPRLDALVEVGHRRDPARVEPEPVQPLEERPTDVLEQQRPVDPREEILPDRMLVVRERDFLGFDRVLLSAIDPSTGDIARVGRPTPTLAHLVPLLPFP